MANTFKLKTKANVGTATSDVYVVPSATTTVVIGVTLANTTGSSINVGVGVTRAATDNVNNKTKEETKERIKNLCINLFPLLIFPI